MITASSILLIVAPVTYIVSIARGTSQPHRMTRFILLFVLGLNFVSILAANGNLGARFFAGIMFAQAALIFIMSLWRGMGGTGGLDWICLAIAAIGVAGWKMTGAPLLGVWFSILADFSAYVPAFVKTWRYPHTESPWYYLCGASSALLGLAAYKLDAFSVFQIHILLASSAMVAFIYRGRWWKAPMEKPGSELSNGDRP